MENQKLKIQNKEFAQNEQETLRGFSQKIATKRQCSSMYVRHIIKGERGTDKRFGASHH